MAYEISSGDILNLESINSNKKIYAGPGAGKTYFIVNNIKEGDYLIIQFGHNDAKNSKPEDIEQRYTNTNEDILNEEWNI